MGGYSPGAARRGIRKSPNRCTFASRTGVPGEYKRYEQVAVMDGGGEIVEEVCVKNANLDDFARRYAGAQATLEATINYYHIHDTLSEHLDVTVAHPQELTQIADTDKITDRVDAKELARRVRCKLSPRKLRPNQRDQGSPCTCARAPNVSRRPIQVH